MDPLISRADARAQGLLHYFTGKPCAHGHLSPRRVKNATCCECHLVHSARHHAANRDRHLARMAKNNARNREAIRASMRERFHTHPEAFVRSHAKRRAAVSGRVLDELTVFVLAEAMRAARRRRSMTGYRWHVDHMVPLARGGAHAWFNVQVIPAALNRWKGSRMALTEPLQWVGFLPGACGASPLPSPLPSPSR